MAITAAQSQGIDHAFGLIPQAFKAQSAEGIQFNLFFKIDGHPGKSLVLKDGALTVHDGETGTPSAIIQTDAETVIGMFTGTIRPEQAFMDGKLNPSDPMEVMALGQVVDLKKLATLAKDSPAPAPAPSAAPSTAPSSASPLDTAFALIPQALRADKAAGKSFNLFFKLPDHPGKSLVLKEGTLTVHEGQTGTPTATIETDTDTVIGMFTGTIRPEQAFMSGKLKPSNPMEVMALGEVVDLKKLKSLAAAPSAPKSTPQAAEASTHKAPQAAPGELTLEACINALPLGFQADKVGNWEKRIFFKTEGAEGYSLIVEKGKAEVSPGQVEGVNVTLSFSDRATAIGILSGSMDPQKAFMDGKIKASNLGAMMKFTQLFTFQPPPAPKAEDETPPAIDRVAQLGKRFPGWLEMVTPEAMMAYASAVGDDNPAYHDTEAGIVAHPIFPVYYTLRGMKQAWDDESLQLDKLRLVHGEQDMRQYAPIRPGDLLNWRSTLSHVEEKRKGTVIGLNIYAYSEGEKVIDTTTTLFIRSKGMNPLGPKDAPPKKAPTPEAPRGEIVVSHSVEITEDLPKRYAEASGDHNPIHLDEAVAIKAGLPGVILQGLCTMALATQGFVDQAAGGDPTRLERFSVRFSKPVLPGNTLTTEGWIIEETDTHTLYGFEVKNEDDIPVVVAGRAQVRN